MSEPVGLCSAPSSGSSPTACNEHCEPVANGVITAGDSALALQDDSANGTDEMEEDAKVLMKADPSKQESLQSEVVPDPMEGEQTWPTEEELAEAEGEQQQHFRTFSVSHRLEILSHQDGCEETCWWGSQGFHSWCHHLSTMLHALPPS